MTDPSFIVEVGQGRTQGADFAQLPALARRLGVSFRDATPPRHLAVPGAGGVRLHALDWGGDEAPALFLHGGQLTAQTWDHVCLGLRTQVRAVALDLRGHGDSDRSEDYSFDSHVADIGTVLDVLAWPKAHLVGMSYGGFIAAHFAAAAPRRVSSLVTIDVGPGVVFEGTARIRRFFQRTHARDGLEAMIEAAMQTSPSSDRERIAYRMAAMMRRDRSGDWRWAHDDRRSPDYPALLTKVEEMVIAAEQLELPCLVVCSGHKEVFHYKAHALLTGRFSYSPSVVSSETCPNVQGDKPGR